MVYVLPEPVTPRRVWYARPSPRPSTSLSIACGWSPAGANDWWRRKGLSGKVMTSIRVARTARANLEFYKVKWARRTSISTPPETAAMSLVAQRLQAIKASPTLAVSAKAARLKAEGKDVIAMGAGEPDFDTPQFIKDAAIAAINKGLTKYTPAGGTPSLKRAIAAKYKRDNGLDYTERQILVSCGGKQTSFNLCMALLNAGDEAIIPAPFWVSYPDMAMMAGGRPVFVTAGIEQGYKITAEQLERAITPRSRLIWINSPSNPTGAVYSADELRALGEVLRKHPQIVIATDDMYEHILLDGSKFVN